MHPFDEKTLARFAFIDYGLRTWYLQRWPFGLEAWLYKRLPHSMRRAIPFTALFDSRLNAILPLAYGEFEPLDASVSGMAQWIHELPAELKTSAFVALESHQFLALEACQHARGFAAFIEQEFRAGSFNFLFAAWRLHSQLSQPPEYRKRFNRRLMRQKRAEILQFLMGSKISPLFLKLLPRLAPNMIDEDALYILLLACKKKKFAQAIANVECISNPGLNFAWEYLPEWLYHPNILQCLMQIAESTPGLATFLPPAIRKADKKDHNRILTSLKSARTIDELEKRLHKLTQQFVLEQKFPQPPFVGTNLLYPVQTGKMLQAEGKYMHNCVAGYSASIMKGDHFFFHFAGAEAATVLLRNDKLGGWAVAEHLGIKNSKLSVKTLLEIYRELAQFSTRDRTLYFDQTRIAGFYYRKTESLWKKLRMYQGQFLTLRKEPENPHDANAIAVDFKGAHIGYVPRGRNQLIGILLDEGFPLEAKILAVSPTYDSAEVEIGIICTGQ